MDRSKLAERILCCVCTKARAAEIVGDLLEQGISSGFKFWWFIWTVIVAMSWRWVPATVLAFYSFAPLNIFIRFVDSQVGAQPQTVPLVLFSTILMACTYYILSALILNLVRFGVKCQFNGVAFFLCGLLVAAASLTRLPYAEFAIPVVIATVVAIILRYRPFRWPFLSILWVASVQAGVEFLCYVAVSHTLFSSARVAISSRALSVAFAAYGLAQVRKHSKGQMMPSIATQE